MKQIDEKKIPESNRSILSNVVLEKKTRERLTNNKSPEFTGKKEQTDPNSLRSCARRTKGNESEKLGRSTTPIVHLPLKRYPIRVPKLSSFNPFTIEKKNCSSGSDLTLCTIIKPIPLFN